VQTSQTLNAPSHVYAVAGDHQVRISGTFPRLYLDSNSTQAAKLRSVDQR
jgi:hypothetical protein